MMTAARSRRQGAAAALRRPAPRDRRPPVGVLQIPRQHVYRCAKQSNCTCFARRRRPRGRRGLYQPSMTSFAHYAAVCAVAGAVAGWLLGALPGLMLGAALAVPLGLLIGQLLLALGGGLLPRTVRAQTARDFLRERSAEIAARAHLSGRTVTAREVERLLERLLLESVRRSSGPAQALELPRIIAAGKDLLTRPGLEERALLRSLLDYIPTHPLWARAGVARGRVAWAGRRRRVRVGVLGVGVRRTREPTAMIDSRPARPRERLSAEERRTAFGGECTGEIDENARGS